MSVLLKILKPSYMLHSSKVISAVQRQKSYWYIDYIPDPYPKTEEERIAAAKKYQLLPEEYEPYPEDTEYGDYPKLPFVGVRSKDPWYPWDYQELRMDFFETPHIRIIHLLPEFMEVETNQKEITRRGLKTLAILIILFFITLFISNLHIVKPISEKQYVTPGVVHYTFDLIEVSNFYLGLQYHLKKATD